MATIPEEIPLALTRFLALGAWLISQNYVLTRRVQGVESLGADKLLCMDKTGTLTLNRMSVSLASESSAGILWFEIQKLSPLLGTAIRMLG